jgi:hypothetical protein
MRWLPDTLTERPMADEPKTTPPETDKFQEHLKGEHHQAKKGVDDAGEIVSTAGGELIDGRIADITDGDDHHNRHPKKK